MIKNHQTYFPGLNALRFGAAFLVILSHIEQNKTLFDIKNYYSLNFFIEGGSTGVTLFFVLSGFLITYLLIEEKKKSSKIDLKKFYIRRILRIWPLYYLILILGFLILPKITYFIIPEWSQNVFDEQWSYKIILYLLILPNISELFFNPIPYISQTWSIGVEEQFYLFWPLIIKYFKNLFFVLLFLTLFLLLLRNLSAYYGNPTRETFLSNSWLIIWQKLNYFLNHFRIGSMAIGGMGALLLFKKRINFSSILFHQVSQILVYIFLFYLIISGIFIPYFHYETYSILFLYLILNISSNKKSVIKLENPVLNFLGKISYGLYMTHIIAIVIVLKTLKIFHFDESSFIYLIGCVIASVSLSIILSTISYYLLEKYFLKQKKQFHYLSTN